MTLDTPNPDGAVSVTVTESVIPGATVTDERLSVQPVPALHVLVSWNVAIEATPATDAFTG